MSPLKTTDLARATGVSANTVRRYADLGLLPPVERSPAGYRLFTQHHLDCMRLARLVYGSPFPGLAIYRLAKRVLQAAVDGDLQAALDLALAHLALVRAEQAQADHSAELLERWAAGEPLDESGAVPTRPLTIGQAAARLGVSIDILRSWDRNGLLAVPRDPLNGYRRYGMPEISRAQVIRMLSRAGYSMAAILRMLIQLDRGEASDLCRALDTPRPDEDVFTASDRWISTLAEQEQRASQVVSLVQAMIKTPGPNLSTGCGSDLPQTLP